MSEYGITPTKIPAVQLRPENLLATRQALDSIAHTYSDAYLSDHPTADPWVVFFAVLHGLQDGVHEALDAVYPVQSTSR